MSEEWGTAPKGRGGLAGARERKVPGGGPRIPTGRGADGGRKARAAIDVPEVLEALEGPKKPLLRLGGDGTQGGIASEVHRRLWVECGDDRAVPFFVDNHVAGQ